MLQGIRRIKKVVLWFLILCIIAIGRAIGYLKIGYEALPQILSKLYIIIPVALIFIAFIFFLIFKKRNKDSKKDNLTERKA